MNVTVNLLRKEDIETVSEEAISRIKHKLMVPENIHEAEISVDNIKAKVTTAVSSSILGQFNPHGMTLGGVRIMDYIHMPEEKRLDYARFDAVNLAGAMTRKWAILVFMGTLAYDSQKISEDEYKSFYMGGGKSVIFIDDLNDLTPDTKTKLCSEFGNFLETLKGEHITGEDMNMDVNYMGVIKTCTNYCSCHPEKMGGTGNPSPVTAHGVFYGMKGLVEELFPGKTLNDLRIGVQGVGNVGSSLVEQIREEYPDAKIIISDINEQRAKELAEKTDCKVVGVSDIYNEEMDIFAPCAGSEILNENTVPMFQPSLKLICGAANCQMQTKNNKIAENVAQQIHDKGIYYAPDYTVNLGGILDLTGAFPGRTPDKDRSMEMVEGAKELAVYIYKESKNTGTLPHITADEMTNKVIAAFSEKNK